VLPILALFFPFSIVTAHSGCLGHRNMCCIRSWQTWFILL